MAGHLYNFSEAKDEATAQVKEKAPTKTGEYMLLTHIQPSVNRGEEAARPMGGAEFVL